MNKVEKSPAGLQNLIDFSSESELSFWSAKLQVRPEAIKTAAKACCSNEVSKVKEYLKTKYGAGRSRRRLL